MSISAWNPPSFDQALPSTSHPVQPEKNGGVVLPSIQELEALRAKAYQEAFTRGLQDGMLSGQEQGHKLGYDEGLAQGQAKGFEQGFQQGYSDGHTLAEQAAASLSNVMACLQAIPETLEADLTHWVYAVATRIADDPASRRLAVAQAVSEALGTLPPPDESIRISVPAAEWQTWQDVLAGSDWPYALVLKKDTQISAGHAYVELNGARMDVGIHARQAIVRAAMGLLAPRTEK